jgi:signal transduction histidine kinase
MQPGAAGGAPAPDRAGRLGAEVFIQGFALLLAVFGGFELVEQVWFREASPAKLQVLHLIRGSNAALLLSAFTYSVVRRAWTACDAALDAQLANLETIVRERTAELRQTQAFTELLFDSLRERIVVTDRGGNVVKANRVALDGASVPLIGRPCVEGNPACASAGECAASIAFETRREVSAVRADAQGRLWEVHAVPMQDPRGDVSLVIEVGRDVTGQKHLEAQLRHQEKMAALGLLAAGFAHDLGNPLASLCTELELLEGENDPRVLRGSITVLAGHVQRIKRTLREMVDFARRRRDEVSDVRVDAVIEDALRLVRHDPRWDRVAVSVSVPTPAPTVRMVEDHLVLVLLNLLLNAADAMPTGGKLSVEVAVNGAELILRVADSGVGMTPEVLAEATKPLFTTKPPTHGTGLGLSVSQDIIRAAGGRLELRSAPLRGTTVVVQLPLTCAASARPTRLEVLGG